MTVQELIDKLQGLPKHLEVIDFDHEPVYSAVEIVIEKDPYRTVVILS